MDKVVANIKCKGSEERLEDCDIELTQNHPGHEVCSKASSVAGLICDSSKSKCVSLQQIHSFYYSLFTLTLIIHLQSVLMLYLHCGMMYNVVLDVRSLRGLLTYRDKSFNAIYGLFQHMNFWYLLHCRATTVQTCLRICAVSPEPMLLAYTRYECIYMYRHMSKF